MPGPSLQNRWISRSIGTETYDLLNLDHPEIEARILDEMSAGVSVYYDRRWDATEIFARWILENPHWIRGKRILVLGAGVGLETIVLGHHCQQLYINDLAPVALELCQQQLKQNHVATAQSLPGRLEDLDLPEVDLAVACYLVYNRDTRAAIESFAQRSPVPLLLVNESLAEFQRLLTNLASRSEELFSAEGTRAILISPP